LASEVDVIADPVETMATVGELTLKGKGPREISKMLDLPYSTVKEHLAAWRDSLRFSEYASVKAQESVFEADHHFSLIKGESWRLAEEAKGDGDRRSELAALKLAGDIESKRVDMLRNAGLLENNELAQQMLETERKQEILANIIRNILCPECKKAVASELSKITGVVEPIG
jgi:hypothetical protein